MTPPPIDPEEEEMLVPHLEFAATEGPQPMEVALSEAANIVDVPVVDDPPSARYDQFSLAVVNQIHNKFTMRKDNQHQFNARESDWGFTSFMPLSELYDPSRGYLLNDTCIVKADVAVQKVVDYWSHDSKKETGYVCLKNQDYKSTRKESFYDLQLDVKGCHDVYASFDKHDSSKSKTNRISMVLRVVLQKMKCCELLN
nr:ubiquitin carboxyl-terminal hydrolase 12-like isoform X1 [Tanacetum cinerariifolium]